MTVHSRFLVGMLVLPALFACAWAVEPDESEPNENWDQATALGTLTGPDFEHEGFTIHSGDDMDCFTFWTVAEGTAENHVAIHFDHQGGDLDMELYDTQDFVDSSRTEAAPEVISLEGLPAGLYGIVVYGYEGAVNEDYRLTVNAPVLVFGDPDAYEPNDSRSAAWPMGNLEGDNHQTDGLSLHRSDDEDWFAFTMPSSGRGSDSVEIFFSNADGDLDLWLYDSAGRLVGTGATETDDEWVTLDALPPGEYVARVYAPRADGNPDYDLLLNLPRSGDPEPDRMEENDATAVASDLGQVASGGLRIPDLSIHSPADEDVFAFRIADTGRSGDHVSIAFAHSRGDLDLALLNATGEVLDVSQSVGDEESLSLEDHPAGLYFAKVYGYAGAVHSDYTLSVYAPPAAADAATDRLEPNDSRSTASNIGAIAGARTFAGFSVPASDEDWYRFELLGEGGVGDYFGIQFVHDDGDLDLALTDEAGAVLEQSDGIADWETVSLLGLAPGVYFAKVYGYEGQANPEYSVEYAAPAEDVDEYPEDWAEPNQERAAAHDLGALSGLNTFDQLAIRESEDLDVDEDWFRFDLLQQTGHAHWVGLTQNRLEGDLDLVVRNAAGELIGRSETWHATEAVDLQDCPPGTYYIRVYSPSGEGNSDYSLEVAVPDDAPVPAEDPFETNDSRTAAHDLGTPAQAETRVDSLSLHTTADEDWFRFMLPTEAGTDDAVEIGSAFVGRGLRLRILSATGEELVAVTSNNGRARAALGGLPGAEVFVAVSSHSARVVPDYSLTLSLPGAVAPPVSRWTVLVYLAGDNELEQFALEDIEEMESIGLPDDISVALLLDRHADYADGHGDWSDTRRGILRHDDDPEAFATRFDSLGEQNSASGQTLADFIDWGTRVRPAERYALVIWDHGGGLAGVCWDYTDDFDSLPIGDLADAVENTGVHFEMIGFDACIQGMAEVVHQLEHCTDLVVASEANEPAHGWNYRVWLKSLASPAIDSGEDLATAAVQTYSRLGPAFASLSAARTDAMHDLSAALDDFAASVTTAADDDQWDEILRCRNLADRFVRFNQYGQSVDLGDFLSRVADASVPASVRQTAALARDRLDEALVAVHADTDHHGTGLAVYLPYAGGEVWPNFSQPTWAFPGSEWTEMLDEMAARLAGPGARVQLDWADGNRSAETANDLHALEGHERRFHDLSIDKPGVSDWFVFETNADGTSGDAVRIEFLHSEGNLDMALYDNKLRPLDQSDSLDDNESISLEDRPAARYFVEVWQTDGALQENYQLVVDAPEAQDIPEDWAEQNDRMREAWPLATLFREPLRFSGFTMDDSPDETAREDWFALFLGKNQLWTVDAVALIEPEGEHALDLAVFDSHGDPIDASTTDRHGEICTFGGASDVVYVRVKGTQGSSSAGYELRVDRQAEITLDMHVGWNLFSLPLRSFVPAGELLAEARVGDLWYWDSQAWDYRRHDPSRPLEPARGYWAFYDAPLEITVAGIQCARRRTLTSGLHLLGGMDPERGVALPRDARLAPVAHTWDPAADPAVYDQTNVVQPGQGAWLQCDAPMTLDFTQGTETAE